MQIIIDRKRKRKTIEHNDPDPLGVRQARVNRTNELQVERTSLNAVDKRLLDNSDPKALLGRKVYALKRGTTDMMTGYIMDVYPSRILLVKANDRNMPIYFDDVISMGD